MLNAEYWVSDPLNEDAISTLKYIKKGQYPTNRFGVLYLTARECVVWDKELNKVVITEKGNDAINYYTSH